jgi:hypothetical protein
VAHLTIVSRTADSACAYRCVRLCGDCTTLP